MKQSTPQSPGHLAVIMDGNGRWAERTGRPRWAGHRAGARVVRDVVEFGARAGVANLTLFAFSSDNWKRPGVEVSALLNLVESHFEAEARTLADAGIRLTVIGRRDRLPASLLRTIEHTESLTTDGTVMHLRVALDYSSRTELASHAFSPLPPVDLLIRTGGERRLSDFLLWECAYAELCFLDVLWPDLKRADLDAAFDDYARRDRRFGAAPARLVESA